MQPAVAHARRVIGPPPFELAAARADGSSSQPQVGVRLHVNSHELHLTAQAVGGVGDARGRRSVLTACTKVVDDRIDQLRWDDENDCLMPQRGDRGLGLFRVARVGGNPAEP